MIKKLLILVLVLGLAFALFITRPTKADFERYAREDTKVVDGKLTGGQTFAGKIGEQLRAFSDAELKRSAADLYLSQCEYENRFFWTNVKKNGQLVYRGAVGHWFEVGSAPGDAAQ
jgi:hypothetical protein